jgi:hypothetical protein
VLAGHTGADLRITLDRLLLEQEFLTLAGMDAASNARLDQVIGVSNALDQSNVSLAEVVGAVKGQSTADALVDALRGQSSDMVDSAGGWTPAAAADLEKRRGDIVNQLATDSFPADTVTGLEKTRDVTLLSMSQALVAHDQQTAAQRLEAAIAANDNLARPLAAALAARSSDLTPATVEGRDVDLRRSINQDLQEHLWWTALALSASADGRAPDAQVPLARADAASADLGSILGQVWTDDVGNEVADGLRSETATLEGIAGGADRRQSATELDRERSDLDGHLASANPLLPPGLMNQQLRASDQPFLVAADAFLTRDYAAAYSRVLEAGRQGQKPADSLALSIVDRFPGRYLELPPPPSDQGPGR